MGAPRRPVPDTVREGWVARYTDPQTFASLQDLVDWAVAAHQFKCTTNLVVRILGEENVELRSRVEQARARTDIILNQSAAEREYVDGDAIHVIGARYGVSADVVRRWLQDRGVRIRSRTENGKRRYAGATREQRVAMTAAARSSPGWRAGVVDKEKIAFGRERSANSGNNRPAHTAAVKTLQRAGHQAVLLKAIGPYNTGVWAGGVAVEITKRAAGWKLTHETSRVRYLLSHGHDILVVCVRTLDFPLENTVIDRILAHIAWRAAHPGEPRVYWAITRTGEQTTPVTLADMPGSPAEDPAEQ